MNISLDKKEKLLSLDKEVQQHAPQMISLVKSATISLEKKGMLGHTAQVALVLDISASMDALYKNGKVQTLVERALALASRFDDNGAIDVFLFGVDAHDVGELRVPNINGYVKTLMRSYPLEGGTRYTTALDAVMEHYFPNRKRGAPTRAALPVYALFVTDGESQDAHETAQRMKEASHLPIYWQFVGIGHSNRSADTMLRQTAAAPAAKPGLLGRLFGGGGAPAKGRTDFSFLERLDELPGRLIDNAGFFSVADPASTPEQDLYDLLMFEYPDYLTAARAKGLLPS